MGFSYQEIVDYRRARSLDGVVEFHEMWFILLGLAEPQRVGTGVVSANFFDVLGVKPLVRPRVRRRRRQPGAPAVLMLSYKYWQRAFGGDPSVVGRIFRMNDRPHQVVGILPPVPQYPVRGRRLHADLRLPVPLEPRDGRTTHRTHDVGIRPGARRRHARRRPAPISTSSPTRMQSEHPDDYPEGARLPRSAPCRCATS